MKLIAALCTPPVSTYNISQLVNAAPAIATENSSMTLVYSEYLTVNNVTGVYQILNDASLPIIAEANTRLKATCGSSQIHCDYQNNRAIAGLCGQLMDILGDPSRRDLSVSPWTSQCFTATNVADNNRCCISWSQQVIGAKVSMLFAAAASTLSQCVRDGLISGWATDVDLHGYCIDQCFSNADHCN